MFNQEGDTRQLLCIELASRSVPKLVTITAHSTLITAHSILNLKITMTLTMSNC